MNNLFITNAFTRDYFKIMIETLTRVLEHASTPDESCLFVLDWLLRTLDLVALDYGFVFDSPLFVALYHAIVTCAYVNDEIALVASRILFKTITRFDLDDSLLNRYTLKFLN